MLSTMIHNEPQPARSDSKGIPDDVEA